MNIQDLLCPTFKQHLAALTYILEERMQGTGNEGTGKRGSRILLDGDANTT
jgi:hypothetical protein